MVVDPNLVNKILQIVLLLKSLSQLHLTLFRKKKFRGKEMFKFLLFGLGAQIPESCRYHENNSESIYWLCDLRQVT